MNVFQFQTSSCLYVIPLKREGKKTNTVISLRNHDNYVACYKSKSKQCMSEIKVCIITASKKGFTDSFTLNQCSVKFEKMPQLVTQMSILLTLAHNCIQCFQKKWNSSLRNSETD